MINKIIGWLLKNCKAYKKYDRFMDRYFWGVRDTRRRTVSGTYAESFKVKNLLTNVESSL